MSNNCRNTPGNYIAPFYGPTVPCNAIECDPCNPELWNQQVSVQYNIQQSNTMEERNIMQGGWSTAYGWHGDLSARMYHRQFFDYDVKTPINFYWTRPPHTDYAWEKCQQK